MIGIWDYTVILTYGSLLSAVMGILVSLSGHGTHILEYCFCFYVDCLILLMVEWQDQRKIEQKKKKILVFKLTHCQIW